MKLLRTSMHMLDTDAGMITFDLRRSRRRTLAIQVHADGQVVVRVPYRVSMREVKLMVRNRAEWVRRKQDELDAQAREYDRLRRHMRNRRYFLGQEYRLQVQRSRDPDVWLGCQTLHVETPDLSDAAVDALLDDWYRGQAQRILDNRMEHCLAIAQPILRVATPQMRLRHMRTQWGSCSEAGRITLNTELVKAPRRCIDYVILHELCHLRELNHSPRYYALLDQVMPGWERHKATLEKISQMF